MTGRVSVGNTSCKFYTIEMEYLSDKLDALRDEIRDKNLPSQIALEKLKLIGSDWNETISLREQFSVAVERLNINNLCQYAKVLVVFNEKYMDMKVLIETRRAKELFARVSSFYQKITKKSDAELWIKACEIASETAVWKLVVDIRADLIKDDNNDEANKCLKKARALLDRVKNESKLRQDGYSKFLEHLKLPSSKSS